MNIRKWLTINANGSARITQGKPDLKWNEISMQLDIEIPNELFKKPSLQASIKIPAEAAIREITTQVTENMREAVKQATSLELDIKIIKEEEEKEQ